MMNSEPLSITKAACGESLKKKASTVGREDFIERNRSTRRLMSAPLNGAFERMLQWMHKLAFRAKNLVKLFFAE